MIEIQFLVFQKQKIKGFNFFEYLKRSSLCDSNGKLNFFQIEFIPLYSTKTF